MYKKKYPVIIFEGIEASGKSTNINNFSKFLKPSHKVSVLKAIVYKFPNNKKKINIIPFGLKNDN